MHDGEPIYSPDGEAFVNTCGQYFCDKHMTYVTGHNLSGKVQGFEVCEACRKDVARYVGHYEDDGDLIRPL